MTIHIYFLMFLLRYNVLSAVFLSKYDFTGISSVFGIIVILKNFQTVPNQTLSRKNGMMG